MLYSATHVMRAHNLFHVFQQMCQECINAFVKNNVFWEHRKIRYALHRKIRYANVNFLISRDCSIKPDLSGTLVSLAHLFHLNAAQRPNPWVTVKHRLKSSSLGKAELLPAQITKQQSLYCLPVQQLAIERIHLVIRAKCLCSFPFIIAINLLNPISNGGGEGCCIKLQGCFISAVALALPAW